MTHALPDTVDTTPIDTTTTDGSSSAPPAAMADTTPAPQPPATPAQDRPKVTDRIGGIDAACDELEKLLTGLRTCLGPVLEGTIGAAPAEPAPSTLASGSYLGGWLVATARRVQAIVADVADLTGRIDL